MSSPAYIENQRLLDEINLTIPDSGEKTTGNIGIFLPANNGDVMSAMSVLKYSRRLWPGKRIIWFCNPPVADAFRYNDGLDEVRPYPWEGAEVDFNTNGMRDARNNRINHDRKKDFALTADLEDGYFPAPWMYDPRLRPMDEYPNISRKVFGVLPSDWEWHPYLCFHQQERDRVEHLMDSIKSNGHPIIMIETQCHSNQSAWHEGLTQKTMDLCLEIIGPCNFILPSESEVGKFIDHSGYDWIYPYRNIFTVRQCGLLIDYCDLFIGVSSGISVATSHWSSKPVPKIQYCGNMTCSTRAMATGPIHVIECEKYAHPPAWDHTAAEHAYIMTLIDHLKQLKNETKKI